jgi:hypothetical protein
LANTLKRLWAGDFVHQMAVDIQNGSAVFFGVDDMFVPDFVVEGAAHGVYGSYFKGILAICSILFILRIKFPVE